MATLEESLTAIVKQEVNRLDMTQAQKAERLGVSQSEVSKMRRTATPGVSLSKLLRMAERCGWRLRYSLEACEAVTQPGELAGGESNQRTELI